MIISSVILLLADESFEIQIAKASSNSGNFGEFSFCLAVLEPLSSTFNHFSLFLKYHRQYFFYTNFFLLMNNDGFS